MSKGDADFNLPFKNITKDTLQSPHVREIHARFCLCRCDWVLATRGLAVPASQTKCVSGAGRPQRSRHCTSLGRLVDTCGGGIPPVCNASAVAVGGVLRSLWPFHDGCDAALLPFCCDIVTPSLLRASWQEIRFRWTWMPGASKVRSITPWRARGESDLSLPAVQQAGSLLGAAEWSAMFR